MSAFFICNKTQIHKVDSALALFTEMGFSSPKLFEVGHWLLYAYPKMSIGKSNIVSGNNCTIISVGTPIYRGLNYSDSLAALLRDYLSGSLDFKQLIGQYTLLFCKGDTIEILCDPLGCKHLFTDMKHSMLSSHMLPICQCVEGDLHVNRKALYEKFLTGIIMPPYTLFEEIIQIDRKIAKNLACEGIQIKFIHMDSLRAFSEKARTLNTCLEEQADALRAYFELLRNPGNEGIDIGLSGGYDSRLALACLYRYTREKLHLHSHSTENVHQEDLLIAKRMANYVGVPCHTVPTKKLNHCDHADEILRKSVLYFDGRSSFSIGGCGEVYTASYRKESTESTPFTLTGVGGELYRNVFDIGFRSIRFNRFMEDKVFSRSFRKAIPVILYRELRDDIIGRAAARLGIDQRVRQTKAIAHRYYCEIMMPDGQGVALDAYNQVSCCIAPFLEPRIIAKGYKAIFFHRSGGEFEGKLIDYIDPGLAALPSSYGYSIGKRPIKAKIKEQLRTFFPASLWSMFSTLVTNKKDHFDAVAALDKVYANSQTMKDAYSCMVELFPEIDFSFLLKSGEDIRRLQFIAMTLYLYKERLKNQ